MYVGKSVHSQSCVYVTFFILKYYQLCAWFTKLCHVNHIHYCSKAVSCCVCTSYYMLYFCITKDVSITFSGNRAELSGAAMYASDMQLCRWIGNEYASTGLETGTIFQDPPKEIAHLSPFIYRYIVVHC